LLNVTLPRVGGAVSTPAEATDNPHLAIAPDRTPGATRWEWAGWYVVHIPIGRGVPWLEADQIEVVRDMARFVAELDWSSPDPEHYKTDLYRHAVRGARDRAWNDFELGEALAVASAAELKDGAR